MSKHDIPIAQVDRQVGLFDARASCLLDALHASVVHASGSGQLQANPYVAGPWLSPGKPIRRAVTTMGSNDLVVVSVYLKLFVVFTEALL